MANKQFNKNQPQKNFFKKFKKRVDKLNYMCYNKYSNKNNLIKINPKKTFLKNLKKGLTN